MILPERCPHSERRPSGPDGDRTRPHRTVLDEITGLWHLPALHPRRAAAPPARACGSCTSAARWSRR